MPHLLATHTVVLYRYLKENDLSLSLIPNTDAEILAIAVPPPKSPAFIKSKSNRAIPAAFEQSLPWADVVETGGFGHVAWYSKDVIPWKFGHVECIALATDKAIANKFDQEDGSTTRKYGGTGFGLSICWQLCELMQGNIEVESEKGKGSTFSFTIKLDPGSVSDIQPAEQGNDSHLKGLRTLIVDDLDTARLILSEQLFALQLRIDTASSGRLAIKKLTQAIAEQDPYRIVITDFHMPEMDGEMLADEINQRGLLEEGVLLFVTSSPRKGDGKRLSNMGFDGYLTNYKQSTKIIYR
jgi:CheY-like chemotaxis protein